MIQDRLPTPKYTIDVEEMKEEMPIKQKYRGYSARNSEKKRFSALGQKLSSRDESLSALKKYQRSPASSNELRVKKTHRKDTSMMLPPRSNRPAGYQKDISRANCPLPPISRIAAGIPSLGPRNYSNLRNRSENRNGSRIMPIGDYNSVGSSGSDRGYKRKIEKASRQRLQQQLINRAFGLPITPISKR